ncbi:hypothetical protein PM082_022940 [Marasmius tenuissimus]|nr:hypothetical protein PM082_022940 [Marasmius tenuissimus]
MDQIFHDIKLHALKEPMTTEDLWRTLRTSIPLSFSPEELFHYIRNAEHDIYQFEDCIERLRERQAVLRHNIARYNSLLSPIQKLPTEILRQIFGLACAVDPQGDFCESATPFYLSSVCGRWREIALNSPDLWANISLELEERTQYPTTLFLECSRQHPLSLLLSGWWDESKSTAGVEVFGLLVDQADRWCNVDLTNMTPGLFNIFDTIGKTPLLGTIAFLPVHANTILAALSYVPRLRAISYGEETGFSDSVYLDTFPWNKIHHLELAFDNKRTPELVFKAMQLGQNIKSLTFYGRATVKMGRNPETYVSREEALEIVGSNLETLSFKFHCADGFYGLLQDFIRGMELPSLRHLTISFLESSDLKEIKERVFEIGSWPRDVYLCFMGRSGCDLTTLVLEGVPLTETEVVSVLGHTPSLHSFTLCESFASRHEGLKAHQKQKAQLWKTVTKSFLQRLEAPRFGANLFSTQSPLIPKLTYLKIGVQSHFGAHRAFVNMVKSRWDRPNGDEFTYSTERLRTAILYVVNGTVEESIYESLKRLDEKGMMVSVVVNGGQVV